ncbi:hypothetical protein K491DRAFT_760021 [Lophiostoma macrostomum CBS 122681]|uniref:HD domain-containing protein n=1 Tax=Lophiostoma macrostomum CBS 122681 TaxID=1314788 RepID=A0A6A6T1Z9_9PLEO|nr:hypothetical protein K491DRAFT_760021 [Lophiostoma macrostomum CBS 122681]
MAFKTRTLATITVPDTALITACIAFTREQLDDHAYNHVMRSWLCGQALISHLPAIKTEGLDLEAYAVGIIMHDLGWSKNPDFISKDKTFEVDGANSARAWLHREADNDKWDKHRIQLVWDLIALHTTPDISIHKEPEVGLACAGIMVDLLGVEVTKAMVGEQMIGMTQGEFDAIAEVFPRPGLKGYVKDTICGFCRDKPSTTYWNFQAGFGERFVEGYAEKLEENKVIGPFMKYVTE